MASDPVSAEPAGFRRGHTARVGHNAVVQLASQLIIIAVGIVLTPLIVSKLGLATYGVWTFITVTIGYLTLVDPGFYAAVVKFGAPRYAEGDRVTPARIAGFGVATWLAIGLLVSPLLFVVAPFIADHLKGSGVAEGQIGWLVSYTFVSLIFSASSSILGAVLVAAGEQWISNVIDTLTRLLYGFVAAGLLLSGHGLAGLAIALGLQQVLSALAMVIVIARRIGPVVGNPFALERSLLSQIVVFGGWAQMANLFTTLNSMTDALVAGTFINASSVGVLSFGQRLARQIPYFSTIPQDSLLQATSAKFGEREDLRALRRVAVDANRIIAMFTTLPGFGLIAVAPIALAAWLNHSYRYAAVVTIILALSHIVLGMMRGARTILIAVGHIGLNAKAQALALVANVILTLALVGPLGLRGIVIGTLGASIVTTIYYQRRFHLILGLGLGEGLFAWAWRLVLPGAAAVAVCWMATALMPASVVHQRGPALLAFAFLTLLYLLISSLGLRLCSGFNAADYATLEKGLPAPLAKLFACAPIRWVAKVDVAGKPLTQPG